MEAPLVQDSHLDFEEDYLKESKRESRKERKRVSNTDRSKYKKSDQKEYPPPPEGDFLRGRVLSVASLGITVQLGKETRVCQLRGALKQEKSHHKNLIVTGDFVLVEGTSIVYVEKRHSVLSRADNLTRLKEQLIAANIDQVLIITSIVDPHLKPTLVDRYIITAIKGNMTPVIVVNKIDLLTPSPQYAEFVKVYSNLGYPFVEVSATQEIHLTALRSLIVGKASVISGQSGVGKTSLINALFGLNLRTADVVERTRKGVHTTSQSTLLPIPEGGFCIDTPGIKSFGMWQLDKSTLLSYFPEFTPFAEHCQYKGCSHTHEPECKVREAIEKGVLSPMRYHSYVELLTNDE